MSTPCNARLEGYCNDRDVKAVRSRKHNVPLSGANQFGSEQVHMCSGCRRVSKGRFRYVGNAPAAPVGARLDVAFLKSNDLTQTMAITLQRMPASGWVQAEQLTTYRGPTVATVRSLMKRGLLVAQSAGDGPAAVQITAAGLAVRDQVEI